MKPDYDEQKNAVLCGSGVGSGGIKGAKQAKATSGKAQIKE